jgi:sulfite exporter TauE/SafE
MTASLLLPALLLGLLGSSHCAVMCGGVASVLCGGLVPLGRGARSAWLSVAYNLGRIATYAALGAFAGLFGTVLDRTPLAAGAAATLRLAAGVLLVGAGLYLAGVLPRFATIERAGAPLWRRAQPLVRRLLPARTARAALGVGALWGLLPCGLVYAALGLALASGTAARGALTMLAFGAGTLPVLLAVGALAMRVARAFAVRPWIRRAAGVVVVALGVVDVAAAGSQLASPLRAGPACCAHHQARAAVTSTTTGAVSWR